MKASPLASACEAAIELKGFVIPAVAHVCKSQLPSSANVVETVLLFDTAVNTSVVSPWMSIGGE